MPKHETPLTAFSTRAHDFLGNFLNQSIVDENVCARGHTYRTDRQSHQMEDLRRDREILGFSEPVGRNQISGNA